MKKISLDPAALAALEADGAVKFNRPLPIEVLRACRAQVAGAAFGLTMKPTFKRQLFTFSSFAAIKAGWAADHFERMARERTRN